MRIRLFAFCLLLGGCQSQLPPLPDWQSAEGRDDPQTGRIVELRSGVTLSPQQLVARLAAAPRVIVGEKHDNPDHHAVELWLAQALGEYRAQGSLLLEMLDPGQQPRVDAVRAQLGTGKPVANLEQALDWQKGWDWTQYGPLVSWAIAQPAPLLAANLQRSEIMRIYRERPPLPGTASRRDSVRRFANPTAACFPTINCRRCSPSSSNVTAAWPSVFAMRHCRRCSSPVASTPDATSAYRSTCATLVRRRARRY